MSRLRCWWLHRHHWTILIPGILPFALDADRFCPICHKGSGRGYRAHRAYVRVGAQAG